MFMKNIKLLALAGLFLMIGCHGFCVGGSSSKNGTIKTEDQIEKTEEVKRLDSIKEGQLPSVKIDKSVGVPIKCEAMYPVIQGIYEKTLKFFDSKNSDAIQLQLDQLIAFQSESEECNVEGVDNFIIAVKNIITTDDKNSSPTLEEKEVLISKLDEAYIKLSKEFCK